jgi:3'-phosphoadenosine 5'-phosphosulfate synthase
VDTGVESKEESLAKILRALEELGYIPARSGGEAQGVSALARLIRPHGGELVDRRARGEARERLASSVAGLAAITLDAQAERDLELLGCGAYSPLAGFMNEKDYLRVVREMRLENGLPWALPITLALSEEEAAPLRVGQRIALRRGDGSCAAVLELADLYRPDREREARELYGTSEPSHPGVASLLRRGLGVPRRGGARARCGEAGLRGARS